MVAAAKAVSVMIAAILAVFAALFCVASGLARSTTDPAERRDAIFSAIGSFVVFAACLFAIVSLTGCSTLYHACKDGLCR